MALGLNTIELSNNRWAVKWDEDDYVSDPKILNGLMYIVFEEMHLSRVGFCIELNNEESEVLEVENTVYFHTPSFNNFAGMYVISGVVFEAKQVAEDFVEYLQKLYFLVTLQQGL